MAHRWWISDLARPSRSPSSPALCAAAVGARRAGDRQPSASKASPTIFEGPVSTTPTTLDRTTGPHPCDGNQRGGAPDPAPTAGAWTAGSRRRARARRSTLRVRHFDRSARLRPRAPRVWGYGAQLHRPRRRRSCCHRRPGPAPRVARRLRRPSPRRTCSKLTGPPATARPGEPATSPYRSRRRQGRDRRSRRRERAAAARTTGADGTRAVTFSGTGPAACADRRPTPCRRPSRRGVRHVGDDGACGTAAPPAGAATTAPAGRDRRHP